MGQALYRKYRSKKLADVIGQKHVTDTLEQALKQGRISHAYLLTGPRGVGKTSIARILAHEINNLPYTDDTTHMDIIEIDAASNRRIDEIRDLRDKVYMAPINAKYKVYIIDEVHMLTREAFNALLKTLEEPPAHVVFILATTDAHKLPETIISRTQRFSFRPVAQSQVIAHLDHIAQQENIEISDDALLLIAEHGEGSFRDSISLLDQAANQGARIEADTIRQLLGIPPAAAIEQLATLVSGGGSPAAALMSSLAALYDQGYQPAEIARRLSARLREDFVNKQQLLNPNQNLQLLDALLQVPSAHDPTRYLEICLLKMASSVVSPLKTPTHAAGHDEPTEPLPEPPETVPADDPIVEVAQITTTPANSKPVATSRQANVKYDVAIWPAVLATLKQRHNTLYGVVRMAEPIFGDDNTLRLEFAFAFHQKRINETTNRQLLVAIIQELTGQTIILECVHNAAAKPLKVPLSEAAIPVASSTVDNSELQAINNIFGGGELLP